MIAQRSARTLMGRDTVSFSLVDGGVVVSGSGIVAGDIEASNGVIHIIDRVILPSTSADREAPVNVTGASLAGVLSVVELAIERGVPIFNDGNHEACAAIYEVTLTSLVELGREAIGNDGADQVRLALAEGLAERDAAKRAWIFRRAMDRVYLDASRRSGR
jgi:hypothetical protein